MRIVVSGVEGVNKGAELMLYAILREIENLYPNAEIYLPISQFPCGLNKIKTSLRLKQNPNKFVRFLGKYHITGMLNRLGLKSKYLNNLLPIKGVEYYLDASGLFFSDQMIKNKRIAQDLKILLGGYRNQGTKIIYLSQAFGPFNTDHSKRAVSVVLEFADMLIARDTTSVHYLGQLGGDMKKIRHFHDFTGTVKGVVPDHCKHLSGRVCIIPNSQIIWKGIMSRDEYLLYMRKIVESVYNNGHEAFFLNHAGDRELICEILKGVPRNIPVISGLDALEVKGVIGKSYLCVSSRFHGVVSSFSQCVPCLTTSWNHKYEELLKLYEMEESLMPSDPSQLENMISHFLLKDATENMRVKLNEKNEMVANDIRNMWETIWKL